MQYTPHSEQAESAPRPLPAPRVVVFLAGALALFGGILLFIGARAIQRQSWDLNWEATGNAHLGPVGIGAAPTSGVVEYRGLDGVRAGVGLAALGAMLVDWSGLLLWSLARGRAGGRPLVFRHLLGWLSFACLVAGLGSFFPPWRVYSVSFWTVVLLGSVAPPWLAQKRRASLNAALFIGLVAGTIAAGYFSIVLSVGMFLALIATGIGYAHLLVLVPAVSRWVVSKTEPLPGVGWVDGRGKGE